MPINGFLKNTNYYGPTNTTTQPKMRSLAPLQRTQRTQTPKFFIPIKKENSSCKSCGS